MTCEGYGIVADFGDKVGTVDVYYNSIDEYKEALINFEKLSESRERFNKLSPFGLMYGKYKLEALTLVKSSWENGTLLSEEVIKQVTSIE